MIEVLAHESAHMLLFGYASNGRVTLNDENSRYSSPLRSDPRPMEGIYHATFVTARMYWAMQQLVEKAELDEVNLAYAKEAMQRDLNLFHSGYQIVMEQGLLSDVGNNVLEACYEYMAPILKREGL